MGIREIFHGLTTNYVPAIKQDTLFSSVLRAWKTRESSELVRRTLAFRRMGEILACLPPPFFFLVIFSDVPF